MQKIEKCAHTDRKYYSRGRCRPCYEAELRIRNPAFAARQKESRTAWAKANPERVKALNAAHHKQKGPLRTAKNQAMLLARLAQQHMRCGICGTEQARRWHQDHNHNTGALRDVLCSRCNNGLGFFDDNIQSLQRAVQYLQRHLGQID